MTSRPDIQHLHPEEVRQQVEWQTRLRGGASPQAQSDRSVAQATAREMPIRAGITRFSDTAQSTILGATDAMGVTDSDQSAQRQVGQAFAEQRPIAGMATDIGGMMADPVWLAAFGIGGAGLRSAAGAGRLGTVGTRLAGAAEQGGVRGFLARETFDAAAGAGADVARAAIGEQRLATPTELATGAALGAGASAALQGVSRGVRGVVGRRAAARQAEQQAAENALRQAQLMRQGIPADAEATIPLAEPRLDEPTIRHTRDLTVRTPQQPSPDAIPVARSERPTYELDRAGIYDYGRPRRRRLPEEPRTPEPIGLDRPDTGLERFERRAGQAQPPRRQPDPTPEQQARQRVQPTRPEPDAVVDGVPAFNSRAAAQRYADSLNTGRIPGDPPATVEGTGGVIPYVVRNAETDVPVGPPRPDGPQTDMPIQGVRRPDTGLERFRQRGERVEQVQQAPRQAEPRPVEPEPKRPNVVTPIRDVEQPTPQRSLLVDEPDAADAFMRQNPAIREEVDALVERGYSPQEAMDLAGVPEAVRQNTGVLAGTTTVDPSLGRRPTVEAGTGQVGDAIRRPRSATRPLDPAPSRPATPDTTTRPVGQAAPEPAMAPAYSGVPLSPAQVDAALRPAYRMAEPQVKGAAKIAARVVDAWDKPLIDRMADSGTQAGREIAARGRLATRETARLLGEWQQPLTDYLHKVSGNPLRRRGRQYRKAVQNLQSVEMDGNVGYTRFQKAVEDDAFLATLNQAEQDIVRSYRDLVKQVSETAQDAGLHIEVGGRMIPFTADAQGRRLIRRPTGFLFDILRRGEGDSAFQDLARRVAEANNLPVERAVRELSVMADRSVARRSSMEVARTLKNFPTHARINGTLTPLLESDPFFAAIGMTQGMSHRLGFIHAFGQDGEVSKRLVEQMAREGGSRFDVPLAEDTLRALSGTPVDMPLFSPGTPEAEVARTWRALEGLTRAAMLTKSFIPNLPETVAKVPAMAGAGRYLRALKVLASDTVGKGRLVPRDLLIETSRNGARSVNVANWMIQPGHARESLVRMAREIGLVVPRAVNEFNEFYAAVVGMVFARDLKAGRVAGADRMRLELLGYKPDEIEQLMRGQASDAIYNDVARKVVEQTQGSTSLSAERSRAANSRVYNSIVAFDSYAQLTMNRTRKVVGASLAKMRSGSARDRIAAGKILAEYFGGHAVAGAASTFLAALSGYGVYGLALKAREAKDDPLAFATDAAMYALVGGPAEALHRTAFAEGESSRLKEATNFLRPVSVVMDSMAMLRGDGAYRNLSGSERALKFLDNKVAISRDAQQWAAMYGLGESDPQLGAAVGGYYRWLRDQGVGRFDGTGPQATRQFRIQMRRVNEAIRKGSPPEKVTPHLRAAFGEVGDARRVRASLQGKRLLTKAKIAPGETEAVYHQRLAELRQRIGDDAYNALMRYDALLDAWGEAVGR